MIQKNAQLTRVVTAIGSVGLAVLAIHTASALTMPELVGRLALSVVLLAWGGLFVLYVIVPIITMIQVAVWLKHKLFA